MNYKLLAMTAVVGWATVTDGAHAQKATKPEAEYAVRWEAGGPADTASVLQVLGTDAGKTQSYTVRYLRFGDAPALRKDESAIGRLRTRDGGGKVELTYKTRTGVDAAGSPWTCPLDKAKSKTEVDVSLLALSDSRTLSRSCELESKGAPLTFPAGLMATPVGCESKMKRAEATHRATGRMLKIEEWTAGRTRILEVSTAGDGTDVDIKRFRDLVAPLFQAGIKPLDRSKTEAVSTCPT